MADERRPLSEHLEELRSRLIRSLLALGLFSLAAYTRVDSVIAWLARPAGGFVFLSPAEAFFVRLKIAAILGGFLAAPVILHEIWRFIERALGVREKKLLVSVLPASLGLFFLGSALAWFVVIPTAARFLLSFAAEGLRPMISIDAYVGFAGSLTVAFGAMFQLPVAIVFLVKLGLATPSSLAAYRRHALFALALAAGVLTPGPDLFSQLALLVPTYLLYEISIWVARRISPVEAAAPEDSRPAAPSAPKPESFILTRYRPPSDDKR